ncbi:MAG: NfeD family protein [Endomicrobium sp.]|jgi:membrane protein implicated in regulation of membrane protease activity|nr:NfeD family protein [Endomicrobium sp.]
MSWFNVLIQIEFAVFVTVSVISVYFIRPVLKRVLSRSETVNSNVDALIGENAVVVENISPLKSGFVKVLSEIWRAESDVEFKVGETAKIKSISGTRLIVKK